MAIAQYSPVLETSRVPLAESATVLTLTKVRATEQAAEQYQYDPEIITQALVLGNMKAMKPEMRIAFYKAVCLSVGLNPLTQPFTVLERQDKTTWLYANSTCAQQLAKLHGVSFRDLARRHENVLGEPLYIVEATAVLPDGRSLPAQGVVSLTKKKKVQQGTWPDGNPKFADALDDDGEPIMVPLRGEALANAMMKCDTKATRRATLALVGLGWVATDYEGRAVAMDMQTGALVSEAAPVVRTPLLDRPAETSKTLQCHIADLFGDDSRGVADAAPVVEAAVVTPEPLPPETPQEDAEGEGHVSGRPEAEDAPGAILEAKTRYARRQALCALVLKSQRSLSEYIRATAKRCTIEATDPDEVLMAISDGWIEGLIREAEAYLAKHPSQPDPTPAPDEATVSAFTLGEGEDDETVLEVRS